jgi:hypothetical protein
VKRVLANIDADHGDCAVVGLLGHGVLLVFAAPGQLLSLARREHGRTIPLADSAALWLGAKIKNSTLPSSRRLFRFLDTLQRYRCAASVQVAGRRPVLRYHRPRHIGVAMSTQLKLFSAREPESFANLEKEVNDWLAAKGDSIQPVNSQTATCAIKMGSDDHQAVVIALWYLDPPKKN